MKSSHWDGENSRKGVGHVGVFRPGNLVDGVVLGMPASVPGGSDVWRSNSGLVLLLAGAEWVANESRESCINQGRAGKQESNEGRRSEGHDCKHQVGGGGGSEYVDKPGEEEKGGGNGSCSGSLVAGDKYTEDLVPSIAVQCQDVPTCTDTTPRLYGGYFNMEPRHMAKGSFAHPVARCNAA